MEFNKIREISNNEFYGLSIYSLGISGWAVFVIAIVTIILGFYFCALSDKSEGKKIRNLYNVFGAILVLNALLIGVMLLSTMVQGSMIENKYLGEYVKNGTIKDVEDYYGKTVEDKVRGENDYLVITFEDNDKVMIKKDKELKEGMEVELKTDELKVIGSQRNEITIDNQIGVNFNGRFLKEKYIPNVSIK